MIRLIATKRFFSWDVSGSPSSSHSFHKMNHRTSPANKKKRKGEETAVAKNSSESLAIKQKKKKSVPNFFIGIRLKSDALSEVVGKMQKRIADEFPTLRKCCTSLDKLHITCFVMELSDEETVDAAVECFLHSEEMIREALAASSSSSSWGLRMNRVDSFSTNVLFVSSERNTSPHKKSEDGVDNEGVSNDLWSSPKDSCLGCMASITALLLEKFSQAGFLSPQMKAKNKPGPWKPHCTIAKTSADKKNGRKLKLTKEVLDACRSVVEEHGSEVLVPLTTIDLLSMAQKDEDGYYKRYASIDINAPS